MLINISRYITLDVSQRSSGHPGTSHSTRHPHYCIGAKASPRRVCRMRHVHRYVWRAHARCANRTAASHPLLTCGTLRDTCFPGRCCHSIAPSDEFNPCHGGGAFLQRIPSRIIPSHLTSSHLINLDLSHRYETVQYRAVPYHTIPYRTVTNHAECQHTTMRHPSAYAISWCAGSMPRHLPPHPTPPLSTPHHPNSTPPVQSHPIQTHFTPRNATRRGV